MFIFSNLPSIASITVSLYREADKKKKRDKNTQIGYITIPITDLQNRQIYEKWHTLSPASLVSKSTKDSKSELPQIRIKIRYQTVDILPLASYNSLVKVLRLLVLESKHMLLSSWSQEDNRTGSMCL